MSLCASSEACMRALLGEQVGVVTSEIRSSSLSLSLSQLPPLESASLQRQPHPMAVASMERTIASHSTFVGLGRRTGTCCSHGGGGQFCSIEWEGGHLLAHGSSK